MTTHSHTFPMLIMLALGILLIVGSFDIEDKMAASKKYLSRSSKADCTMIYSINRVYSIIGGAFIMSGGVYFGLCESAPGTEDTWKSWMAFLGIMAAVICACSVALFMDSKCTSEKSAPNTNSNPNGSIYPDPNDPDNNDDNSKEVILGSMPLVILIASGCICMFAFKQWKEFSRKEEETEKEE